MNEASSEFLDGKLSRDRLTAVLTAVSAQAGLSAAGAELIKFTNNAVFRLAEAPVVVRIAGSTAVRGRIHNVVKVARWLAEHDVPAVRLLDDVDQPINAGGHLATLWHLIPPTGSQPTGRELARLLRQVHDVPSPTFELPRWLPFTEIRQRLAEPEGLHPDDREFLIRTCDRVEGLLASIRYVLQPGVIHGDPFLGNLVPGPRGPVLCDFDSTTYGPREWDLTPMAVGKLRLDYPADEYSPFAAEYGFDVMSWDGFDILRQVRELKLVTSVVPILRSNPSIREQFEHRLRTFKLGDRTTRWTPYR